MKYDLLKIVGAACKRYRQSMNITQKEVGEELGYCMQAISNFECGKNNNMYMLFWYVSYGFDLKGVLKEWQVK